MSEATTAPNGRVDPEILYTLPALKAAVGWSDARLRTARRQGLPIKYLSNKGYVFGRDFIDFILRVGKPSR
jgi:hypothetical protein